MNNCKEVGLDLVSGSLNASCNFINSSDSYVTSKYYLNLSKITFTRSSSGTANIILCRYDKNYNFVSRDLIEYSGAGDKEINLDPNYYVKFAVRSGLRYSLKGYQCNIGIGSMSNELAFGSVKYNDTIGVIIPFVIIIIGFALGYSLLKKLIYKGNKGKTI